MNSVQIKDKKNTLIQESRNIIDNARKEIRMLNDAEKQRIEEIKAELQRLNDELAELEKKVEVENPTKEENSEPEDENQETTDNPDNQETQENQETQPEDKPEGEEEKSKRKNNRSIMSNTNSKFSLLRAIRSIAENKQLNDIDAAVITNGEAEMRKAGLNWTGNIQLPMTEEFRTVTVATEHDDVIATDMMNVLEPLHSKNVLLKAGVKFLSGLKGDVQYPVMSSISATWESETATTSASTPTFSNVKLQPKRLSVVVPISKQFLIQDSVEAEQAIRNEIVNAISAKLESTIFDASAGTTTRPAGLFNTTDASVGTISNFTGICNMEAKIETENMENYGYILSPTAKAAIRGMAKGSNTSASVWENGEIDGVKADVTTHITGKKIIAADWSNLCLAQFGSLDITVDTFTLAADGCVRLVVNSYWDFKPLRSGAFAWGTLA